MVVVAAICDVGGGKSIVSFSHGSGVYSVELNSAKIGGLRAGSVTTIDTLLCMA